MQKCTNWTKGKSIKSLLEKNAMMRREAVSFLQISHFFALVWPLLLEYCIQYFKFYYFCPIYGFGLSNQWLRAVMHGFPFSNLYSAEGLADQLLKDRIADMLLAHRKSILGLLDTVVRGVANPNLQSLILFCETNLKMLPWWVTIYFQVTNWIYSIKCLM